MSNHLKFCGCRFYRSGMHTKTGGEIVKRVIRKFRRAAKEKLRKGQEPDYKISVPYTD
jgi:hypothetical protein